jgi:hypothetical protein
MDDQLRAERLEQALRDERAEREAAQQRAALLAERAETWETRAIERAARIERLVAERERLVAERERLRTARGWISARRGGVRSTTTASDERGAPLPRTTRDVPTGVPTSERLVEPSHDPAYPAVQIVAITDDPLMNVILGETDVVRLDSDQDVFARADLVVVETEALDRLGSGLRDRFRTWHDTVGRQPLALISEGPVRDDLMTGRKDVSLHREWKQGNSADADAWTLPTTFDVRLWTPTIEVDEETLGSLDGLDRSLIEDRFERLVVTGEFDPSFPWMVALAASGTPFIEDDEPPGSIDIERRGSLIRRTVYQERAPWIAAAGLLQRAGVGCEPPVPMVAGILVSNRPERVVGAIEQFGRQTYLRIELVVGCHGFSSTVVAEAIDRLPNRITVTVLEFDAHDPLGRCLNAAIGTTGSSIIAKIDDDDHYGPGYLEDAVQAVRYARAPLVGKGATFTYLESRDETILRRPKIAERFYNGSPTGASLVFERHLWERIAFPHRTLGEDLAFIRGAKLLGIQPYATSPWEFVYHRAITGNTWNAIDEVFLEGSVPAWSGNTPELADLDSR